MKSVFHVINVQRYQVDKENNIYEVEGEIGWYHLDNEQYLTVSGLTDLIVSCRQR